MNTFRVNALAEDFHVIDDLIMLEKWCEEYPGNKFIILGGGSNILFVQNPAFTVLKNELKGINIIEETRSELILEVASGENWHDLVQYSVEKDWGGLENLALIPGSVGAAPVQNIGAYGVELKDRLHSVVYFDMETGKTELIEKNDCQFSYRDSIFKNRLRDKAFILKIRLELTKEHHPINISYGGLQKYLDHRGISQPGIQDVFNAVVEIRTQKLPDFQHLGNAGSFFKNPLISMEIYDQLALQYPSMPFYPAGEQRVKLAAGWLIDMAGWKGKRVGNVGTYEKQALVIVNHGGATGLEIFQFSSMIQASVFAKFGIALEEEVNIIK